MHVHVVNRPGSGREGAERAEALVKALAEGSVQIAQAMIPQALALARGGGWTKIDNLVQIGHNCVIGNDCLICGQTGLAGSVTVGNNVVMAGQTGVADNIFIGDNVITGGGTKLLSNVPAGRVMLGYPAMKMDAQMDVYKGLRRLKRLFSDVAEIKKTVSNPPKSD